MIVNQITTIFNLCKIAFCYYHVHTRYTNFNPAYFDTLYMCLYFLKVTMHNVIISKSHGGHIGFMQMRHLLSLRAGICYHIRDNTVLQILLDYFDTLFILICFKVMRHYV